MASNEGQRSHSETEYRDLLVEYQSLQRKFDSKVEALLVVSQELANCQSERDRYKSQALDYVERSRALKSALLAQKKERNRKETAADEQQQNLVDLLNRMNEENRLLQRESDRLKAELEECRGDNKLLRQQLAKYKLQSLPASFWDSNEQDVLVSVVNPGARSTSTDETQLVSATMIDELEKLKSEHSQLEGDLKSMLCEKEELVIERDAFKNKAERLNRELNYILNGDDRRTVADVDQLIAENRFLKEQLQHAREENGLRKAELSKYKSCLEKRKPILKSAFSMSKCIESIDQSTSTSSPQNARTAATGGPAMAAALLAEGLYPLITPKQVKLLLQQSDRQDGNEPPVDFRALASALNDALNDRNLALSHQRKANNTQRNSGFESELNDQTTHRILKFSVRNPSTQESLHVLSPRLCARQSSKDANTMTDDQTCMTASVDRLKMGVDLTGISQSNTDSQVHDINRRRIHSLQSQFMVFNGHETDQVIAGFNGTETDQVIAGFNGTDQVIAGFNGTDQVIAGFNGTDQVIAVSCEQTQKM